MREIEIHDYARQLLEAHGAKAIAEAAQNAIDLEAKGEFQLAKDWRHIAPELKLPIRARQRCACTAKPDQAGAAAAEGGTRTKISSRPLSSG
jgi:hypothetical protein